MPSILNLKFKGNKSFVAFSNLSDGDSLTRTWKVCTKVASCLEQGQRLENLSWRLWHLQSLMVDTDNAKSKREFKKLSKTMSDKLDKEKGRSIEELEAPDFKRNPSTDMIRLRAVEKERNREASQNAQPGTIKRMQFTFSVDQQGPPVPNTPVKKPDLKPSAEFKDTLGKRSRAHYQASHGPAEDFTAATDMEEDQNDADKPLTQRGRRPSSSNTDSSTLVDSYQPTALHFPSIFNDNFGPSALLYPSPTLTTSMNYGEGVGYGHGSPGFSICRPTIELPLDEILNNVDGSDSIENWAPYNSAIEEATRSQNDETATLNDQTDVIMSAAGVLDSASENDADDDNSSVGNDAATTQTRTIPPLSQAVKEVLPQTVAPSKILGDDGFSSTVKPSLTVRTQGAPVTRSSGPGATATSLNPAVLRQNGNNSAPGGVKAECSNCGATHTPLWRRGLNDELNCNACGLYCKLHKRPRPKSMRSTHGEGRTQTAPRQESVDVMAQCYNCHTTATPLWRKDDEGKTVCNACGLYYKLHGSARPISMKSDVIRKRSRHDARRILGISETPSASPGASRRASPSAERSPTLAPDSTTQISYDYSSEEREYNTSQSELANALGVEHNPGNTYTAQGTISSQMYTPFPGPYHPDYLFQNYASPTSDPLPFASVDSSDIESIGGIMRSIKRRRMSTDSASEPPSSAVSYSSYPEEYSSQSSTTSHSARSSMDFPYSFYSNYQVMRGSSSILWHPPMLPQDNSPQFVHPPMLPSDEGSMDYPHPPMVPQDDDSLFSAYLHPPMVVNDDHSNSPKSHQHMSFNDNIFSAQNPGQSDFYDSAMQTF